MCLCVWHVACVPSKLMSNERSQLPPSERNNATTGNNCAGPTEDVDNVCNGSPAWNVTHPTYCGANKLGECDGGKCYAVVR